MVRPAARVRPSRDRRRDARDSPRLTGQRPISRGGPLCPPTRRQARRPAAGPAVRITPGRPSSGPRRYSPPRP